LQGNFQVFKKERSGSHKLIIDELSIGHTMD